MRVATRLIISWMSTVLPTPAPPNRPILPPSRYGESKSMTLMPVSNICLVGARRPRMPAAGGVGPALAGLASGSSRASPHMLKMWPRADANRNGDRGAGVARRTTDRPSVGTMATARTLL